MTKTKRTFRPCLALSTLLATAATAQAHPGHGQAVGFAHGFAHPLGGWDHLLAMLAVGLWAAQLATGKRNALWGVPLAFVGTMALGGVLGAAGFPLPAVEAGIAASVLVLGVLIAAAVRLPLAASMALAGAFALFHGYAHGAEMPLGANGLEYGAGFVLATILLHSAGIGLALACRKLFEARHALPLHSALPLRFAGAAIACCGLMLLVL